MYEMIKKFFRKDKEKSIINLLVTSFVLNFIVESFSRASILKALIHIGTNPFVFFYNMFIIFLTLSISILVRRRTFVKVFMCGLWTFFAVTDFVLLKFRTTPFTAVDFSLVSEALPMVGRYLNIFEIILAIAAIIGFIALIIIVWLRAPRFKGKINYFRNIIVIGIIALIVFTGTKVGNYSGTLAVNFGNLGEAYINYGFVYCFSNSLINTGISKPDNYSPEVIDEIVKETISSNVERHNIKNPNVIIIQLESFFDPTYVKGVTFSEDPIPNYHRLQDSFSSGLLTVPSVGAGTANTEFEVITGMSLRFFGPGEYPYKTVLKDTTCESIAYNLKDEGYATHAIHNNDGTFYGRNVVFPNLGFDTFTSLEYMYPVERNPMGWAKDSMLIGEIMDTLQSTDSQDFIYGISVQGHGKYPSSEKDNISFNTSEADKAEGEDSEGDSKDGSHRLDVNKLSDHIKASGMNEEYDYAFNYYVNQIHEMDDFVGELTDKLKNCGEDAVVVFFGDHLPSMGFAAEDLSNNSLFQTPYIIWDNFGLEEEDMDMYAYQLSAKVLGRIGFSDGIVTKLHQNVQENTDEYLNDLRLLQYDMLYGKKEIYNKEQPYSPTDMKMGIHDIKIDNVSIEDGEIVVSGENFTEFSKILINDKKADTEFFDKNTLKVNGDLPASGDVIKVVQIGEDGMILSSTDEYKY